MKTLLSTILIALFAVSIFAQEYNAGLVPQFAIKTKLAKKLNASVKIESFHALYTSSGLFPAEWKYDYRRTAFQGVLGYKVNSFWGVSAGYETDVQEDDYSSHQLIQQCTYVRPTESFRFGIRLRTDETFYEDDDNRIRIRARTTFEIPAQGNSIESGEFYYLFSEEAIMKFQEGEQEYENRFGAYIGYYNFYNNKIQIGIDYRLDKFEPNLTRHRFWLFTSMFVNI